MRSETEISGRRCNRSSGWPAHRPRSAVWLSGPTAPRERASDPARGLACASMRPDLRMGSAAQSALMTSAGGCSAHAMRRRRPVQGPPLASPMRAVCVRPGGPGCRKLVAKWHIAPGLKKPHMVRNGCPRQPNWPCYTAPCPALDGRLAEEPFKTTCTLRSVGPSAMWRAANEEAPSRGPHRTTDDAQTDGRRRTTSCRPRAADGRRYPETRRDSTWDKTATAALKTHDNRGAMR